MPEVQFVTVSSERKDHLRTEPFLDILAGLEFLAVTLRDDGALVTVLVCR
jgi:hypothetical protein